MIFIILFIELFTEDAIATFSKKFETTKTANASSEEIFSKFQMDIMGSLLIGIKIKFDIYAVGGFISTDSCCSKLNAICALHGATDSNVLNFSFSGLLLDLLCNEEVFQKAYDWIRLHQIHAIEFSSFLNMYSNFCGITELSREYQQDADAYFFVPTRQGTWKKVYDFDYCQLFEFLISFC